jgi:hypothetical protein
LPDIFIIFPPFAEIIEDAIEERPEDEEDTAVMADAQIEALIDQLEREADEDFARLEEDIVQA